MWNKVPKNEYHKGKPGKKKDPFKKDVIAIDNKSMMGYRDDSPYRNLPIIDINTPSGYIDMSATGIPLFANGQYLPPYSGQHFMGTNVVRETPVWDKGFDIPPPPGHIDFIDKGFDIPSKTTARYYPGHPEYFQQGGDPSIPELDQAKKGGWLNKYSKMPKKTSSKNIKTSINKLMTKNPLFERNYMLYGAKGPRLYDPSSKYQTGGSVSDLWSQTTGLNWSEAKTQGLTDGSYDANIALKQRLLNGEFGVIKESEPSRDLTTVSNQIPSIEANSFNEAFKIARESLGKNQIFEYNGRKYGTNLAGEEFNPSEETLKVANLNDKSTKERLKEENKKVKSPYTNKNTVKLEPEYKSWEQVKKDQLDLNKNDQASLIVNYKKTEKTNKNYVIIDKNKGLLHVYKEGESEPLYTSPIDVGQNPGDAQTVTKYKDTNNDGKITDADKVNGKFEVDWSAGNMSTGAGKYYISNIDPTGYSGLPILNMMNESQYDNFKKTGKREDVATSFHKGYVSDDNSRVSNGCIRCNKTTLDNLVKNLQNASEVYILPEDTGNAFVLENGKLNFKTNSKKNYNEYTDSKGIKRLGQGINKSVNTLNYRPIKIELDEKAFKENVFGEENPAASLSPSAAGVFYTNNDEEEFNSTTKPFINSLAANKQKIMKAAKINGDVYNEIAKMTFGIYGTESNFGDTHSAEGNFARAVGKAINPKQSSSPDYKSKYNTYGATENDRSVGLTQIRFSYLNEDEKKALSEVGITENSQFMDPELAAIGTAVVLGVRYNQQLNQSEKENMWEYLPSKWNTRSNYGERVKNNSRYISVMQYDGDVNRAAKGVKNIKPVVQNTKPTAITASKYTGPMPKAVDSRRAFAMGGWLDQYQDGGVTINSEEEYKKSLLMKNKTKERMDAERAWASKKVAAANAAKAKKPAPSAQQLFGIQPVAAESTGVNKTPQAGLDYKNEVAQSFHKAVDNKMKEKPNLTREQAQTQVNIENTYAQGRAKGQGTIRQADPEQGLLSKTVEVVSHPFNALDAYVQSGYVPDYFSYNKDAVNPMDVAYSITPAGWYTQGADALYNDLPTDIEQGNWMGAANDILMGLPLGIKATQLGRTYIPQTYKINPWAFKPNPKAYYRMIGKEGYADALESGVIRPPQTSRIFDQGSQQYIDIPIPAYEEAYYNAQFPLDKRWYPQNKITINPKTGKPRRPSTSGYEGPYMAEVTGNSHLFENAENVAAYRGPNASQTVTYSKEFIPINTPGVKFYKEDWLRGYKPVDVPTQLPGSPNNIVPKTPPNPALGNPIGTINDIKSINPNIKILRDPETGKIIYQLEREDYPFGNDWETMAPKDFTNYSTPWINKYYSTSGGYSDIPQFNQQVQNFNTEMQFGKRPLETQINIRPETQRLLGEKAFTESTGDYPMYFNVYGTPYETVPGLNLKRRNPLSGYEMFQQIQPNKYGGSPRKSDKKLVNYSQNPNFVKTSWLDKYK